MLCHEDYACEFVNFAKIMIKCLCSHTKCSWNIKRKISSEFFARSANHNKFFNDFCKIQAQNLKTYVERFQVVIRFHPGHPWPKILINGFTELVWCLNKKLTIIFRFSFMQMRLLALQGVTDASKIPVILSL